MTKASRAERMRRLLLEDSKDDSSSAGSNERDTPFDLPSTNNDANESKEEQNNSFNSIPFTVGIDESFGFEVADEQQPLPATTSKEEMIDMGLLKYHIKYPSNVKSVDANAIPDAIDGWIKVVEEAHVITTNESNVHERDLSNMKELMQPWPDEMKDALVSGEVAIPPSTIDLSLDDYASALCLLLGVPVKERLIDSVHALMLMYAELNEKEEPNTDTHSDIAFTVDEWN